MAQDAGCEVEAPRGGWVMPKHCGITSDAADYRTELLDIAGGS